MTTLSSLSIFFPAYNEEGNIAESVEKAISVASRVTNRFEVIVVNDASADATASIVKKLEKKHPNIVHLISHPVNKGYGAALITGIRAAQYDYIFFTDADLQFDLQELSLLTKHVKNYDVVIGYRKIRRDPFIRLLNAKGWNLLNRLLFNLKVKDIDGAFKLMKRSVVQSLPLQSQGAMVSAELLIRLSQRGVIFKEVPVTHLPRTRGNATGAKPDVIFRAFNEMLAIFMGDVGKPTRTQLLTFGAIGILNTTVDVFGYVLLTRNIPYFALHYVLAKAISFFAGTLTSFALNKYVTFKQHTFRLTEVFRFYGLVGISLVLNSFIVYLATSVFGVYDLVSVVIATIITFALNFVGSKIFVFIPRLQTTGSLTSDRLTTQTQ